MKSKKFLLAVVLVFVFSSTILCAQMTQWTWSAYDFSFSIPNDFNVTQNTSSLFVASSSDNQFSVEISPWSDASLSASEVAYAALNSAQGYWTNIQITEEDWIESGYETYVVIGTANKDGYVLNYVIVGVIDPEGADNLFVRFSWWDGQYNSYYEDLALQIAATFQ